MTRTPCNVVIPARRARSSQPPVVRMALGATVIDGKGPRKLASRLNLQHFTDVGMPRPVVFTSDNVAHSSAALAGEWQAAVNLIRNKNFRSN